MIKVSIIIPVYNAEKYLEKCLDSVINQTLKEIEIICIDDCSTDNSYSILERYRDKYNGIIICKNIKNSGSSFSRNLGLSKAKGEYIGFIDSDDYIDERYFEELYNTAKKYDSDITCTENIFLSRDNNIYPMFNNIEPKEGVYKKDTSILIEYIQNVEIDVECRIVNSIWSKIWKKEFLLQNNIVFGVNSIGEDYYFVVIALAHSPKMSYINKENARYYYVQYDKNVPNADFYFYNDLFIQELIINYYRNNAKQYIKNILNHSIRSTYNQLTNVLQNTNSEDDKEKYLKEISNYFNKLNLNNNELKGVSPTLKSFYLNIRYEPSINVVNKYVSFSNILRKWLPRFLLKPLRIRNIILN